MDIQSLIGQKIGKYLVLEQIGKGGMAFVYKAIDQSLERHVALKVLIITNMKPEESALMFKYFVREAKSLAKLIHPNIVSMIDFGEEDGFPYLIMPYLSGGTLKSLPKPMPYIEAIQYIEPIARALDYAHKQNIIHRDVKPSNILLTENKEPMLSDFGVAKLLSTELQGGLTATGGVVGTPSYMPVEQWYEKVVPQSDQYALGVVLFELLTGRLPFEAKTPVDMVVKQSKEAAPQAHQLNPTIPEELSRIIAKTLALDVQARYKEMLDFAIALSPFKQKEYSAPPASTSFATSAPRPIKEQEKYSVLATSKTPALVIYLLDVSSSMTLPMGDKRRVDIVMEALYAALQQMVFRSTKGTRVSPRYRIAMYAYSDHVYDLLDGIRTVDYIANLGIPELETMRSTDTARGFKQVEKLLIQELPRLDECPAPLVCHMTDGEFTGNDPQEIVKRIMNMKVPDGNILVENIFISDSLMKDSIEDVRKWSGISPHNQLDNEYANQLRTISSVLPASYTLMMRESGYQIASGALMMLPGINRDLIEMGFVMSSSTPVSHSR